MKILYKMIVLLFILQSSIFAQLDLEVSIENQTVNGSEYSFDVYLRAPNTNVFPASIDFFFVFNSGNFSSPTAAKGGVNFVNLIPTDNSGFNGPYTSDGYNTNTAVTITGNEFIINVSGPAPGDQSTFDTRVAKIDAAASTYRLGRFTITGITNAAGTAGLEWNTSRNSRVFSLGTTAPWNGTEVNLITSNISDTPLPVELSSFSVNSVEGTKAQLKWETATEVNNYGFEIERSLAVNDNEPSESKSELNWEKVTFIKGHGNSNSTKTYSFTDKNLVGGSKFIYRLKQIDIDGTFEYSDAVEIEVLPNKYELLQNYPNPFNPETNIKFSLPEDAKIAVNIYNVLGERVATILNKELKAGFHQVNFNTTSAGYKLSSGVYIYTLETKNFSQVKKMILMK